MIHETILQTFPALFGAKKVGGRELDVEQTIEVLTRELRPAIAHCLNARRVILSSPLPVRKKYAWPAWDERYEDPVGGRPWTYREIVQGMIDNFLDRPSPHSWRLNDEVPIPADAHPLRNAGLELTGPWHPLDMAFNALNSAAPMNMPDFEDASPTHFRPEGASVREPVAVFSALQNAKEIFEEQWKDRAYEVVKKNKTRAYRIARDAAQWPTRFVRPPSIHLHFDQVLVDGQPAPGLVVVAVLWTLNNYDALQRLGTGVYFYIPKMQSPHEALIVERLFSRLEGMIGIPAGTIKIKMLYEEGNGGRTLPAIVWTLRRRLLGTNVGRWDYLGSLIEMWKDDPNGIFPDPQTVGMSAPNMIAYQRYNALVMLLAGLKHGEFTQGAPIGGMAAVMIYQQGDTYGRARYNQLALRAMAIDKLRERLLGLMFVPSEPLPAGVPPTLEAILAGQVKGKLYDAYRQSWVASPETSYVAAGNKPLRASLAELQALLDAPRQTVDVKGKPVPTVDSGLTEGESQVLHSRGLIDAAGKITPRVIPPESLDAPEKFLSPELWESIYGVPTGDVTIEHIQHAFYMAANYGYQILNGNFAAAIDDYELHLRFMNDLATYRIDMSWLWTLLRHKAIITKAGHLKHAQLTEDGVVPARDGEAVKAGTPFTAELFAKVFEAHNEWTAAFFAEQDKHGEQGRFDRSKAAVIMELLQKQLLSPRYIQHSARVLFVVGPAAPEVRREMLEAIFDLTREELRKRVSAGSISPAALAAHDYVFDVFEEQ
ncbi:MAG: malate synthase [Acidobacteriota bacterium]|nr:malate synthase [Acidobacteriota bacterium]